MLRRLSKPTSETTQQVRSEPILKVIRRKCLDCSADQPTEVRLCPVTKCPLCPYRMGANPFAKPRGLSPPTQSVSFKKTPLLAENSSGNGPICGDRRVPTR
jgi:hypothetical protein